MFTDPSNHCLGVLVRRKDRIDAMQNTPATNNQSEALEQAHSLNLKPRQPQRC